MPIDPLLPQLLQAVAEGAGVVLRAPPGAGKTTRVPVALLDGAASAAPAQGSAPDVLLLEPRRIAARAAARWIAQERGSTLGDEIGYQVRFERRASAATRLLVMTEGILLRRLQRDPFLEGTRYVVFDEFHERRADSDLLLAMVRRVQRDVRPDLRIIVMSATLAEAETAAIARYLGDVPILESEGRHYPVDVRYADQIDDGPLPARVAHAVAAAAPGANGDILAFLPGVGEIERTATQLRQRALDLEIVPLYGNLTPEQQDAALRPAAGAAKQRVVLATNVAETSVTVPGITVVVDSGMVRRTEWDVATGMERLVLTETSQASADQRAGRAGRTAPGVAVRLWTERQHGLRATFAAPEIVRSDLTAIALQLLAWGERDLSVFPWFEAPPAAHLEASLSLLRALGAIAADAIDVTAVGHELLRLPAHPRVARFLTTAARGGAAQRAALAAALLEERDPFRNELRGDQTSPSDLLDRIHLAERNRRRPDLQALFRSRDQRLKALEPVVRRNTGKPSDDRGSDETLLRALVLGFPDRLARRRPNDPRGAVLASGRGVRLSPRSRVHDDGELLICHDVHGERDGELMVHSASAIPLDWIPRELLQTTLRTEFDAQRDSVVCRKVESFAGLIVRSTDTGAVDREAAAESLAAAAARELERALPLASKGCASFLSRVRFLAAHAPELELPTYSDDELITLLPQICAGRRSFKELARMPLHSFLLGLLPYEQQQALAREAPEHFTVPSGTRIRLQYEDGRAILPVRIQEIFGISETPRIARGRTPLVLHLLAPNYRPQQITDDLANFWKNTYFDVRKELRRRYPKHPWPEDPATAKAIRK